MPLLEVEGLVKYYGNRPVVNGVSFAVDKGEVVGLLGPNGAGKTTSFRMATGQIAPNDGKVTFNGEDVTPLPMYQRARRGMGYLDQAQSVFRKLSVEGNLLAILEALPRSRKLGRRLTRAERWERTNEALARFQLDTVRKNTAGRCSGGEKRRLEIARCLVCEPLLILLDEPFAAVDPKTTEDIRANIRELANSGIGILITDHNVREVFRTADRVYLITNGKVVTRGTPHELVNDQIAIDAYLGRSFEEDGFTRHFDARAAAAARAASESGPTPAAAAPPPAEQPPIAPAPPAITPPPAAMFPPAPLSPFQTPPPVRSLGEAGVDFFPAPVDQRAPTPPQHTPGGADAGRPAQRDTDSPAGGRSAGAPAHRNADVPTVPAESQLPPHLGFPAVAGSAASVLDLERVRRAVEGLANDSAVKASTVELAARGVSVAPALLEAMERRDATLRRRAGEVFKFVAKAFGPFEYDPDAPYDVLLRQVAHIRAKLERRR
jgi:lipopolysaccharide export system ATP-binding protein